MLEQRATTVRVVLEDAHLRVAVLVAREDLAFAPVVKTRLVPSPALEPVDDEGVFLAPGTAVQELGHASVGGAPWREVEGAIDVLRFRGWIPEASLGRIWTEAPFAEVESTGLVRDGASLGVRAKGSGRVEEVARAGSSSAPKPPGAFAWGVESLGARPPNQLVRFVRPEVMVIGEVAQADFKEKGPGDGEWSTGGGTFDGSGGMFDMRVAELRTGAALFAPGTDVKVGFARAATVAYHHHRVSPPRVEIWTHLAPVGFVRFTVEAADLAPRR